MFFSQYIFLSIFHCSRDFNSTILFIIIWILCWLFCKKKKSKICRQTVSTGIDLFEFDYRQVIYKFYTKNNFFCSLLHFMGIELCEVLHRMVLREKNVQIFVGNFVSILISILLHLRENFLFGSFLGKKKSFNMFRNNSFEGLFEFENAIIRSI